MVTILLLEYQANSSFLNKTDFEFVESVSNITDNLVDEFEAFSDLDIKPKMNAAAFSLWRTFHLDYNKLAYFIKLYTKLNYHNLSAFETDFEQKTLDLRRAVSLKLPWSAGESWISGGTHSNTGFGSIWSSYDFQNPACFGWGCTANVTAAHSGTVANYPDSQCSVKIIHDSGEWQTRYYHMKDLRIRAGDYVNEGQVIGRYADDHKTAICDGGFSTGPHVHFTLYNRNGHPISLHNHYISGYRVNVGIKDYDEDCTRCYMEKDGQTYCPGSLIVNKF
jgi:LasA protease